MLLTYVDYADCYSMGEATNRCIIYLIQVKSWVLVWLNASEVVIYMSLGVSTDLHDVDVNINRVPWMTLCYDRCRWFY